MQARGSGFKRCGEGNGRSWKQDGEVCLIKIETETENHTFGVRSKAFCVSLVIALLMLQHVAASHAIVNITKLYR